MPIKSIEQFPYLFTQLKILNGGQYQHQLKISLKLNTMEDAFLNFERNFTNENINNNIKINIYEQYTNKCIKAVI